jgi:hypothetical protein
VKKIAEIKGLDPEQTRLQILENVKNLFNIWNNLKNRILANYTEFVYYDRLFVVMSGAGWDRFLRERKSDPQSVLG